MIKYIKQFVQLFLKDPTKYFRYVVLFLCCILVVIQLSTCYSKFANPPTATHSHFNLNESILLPAVTLCREPPYKSDILEEYNLCVHPKYGNCWRKFNFSENRLDDLFQKSTFQANETFISSAIHQNESLIHVTISLQFNLGKCFTLSPLHSSKYISKDYGYSIMLQHHVNLSNVDLGDFIKPAGWHIFIHESSELFTEFRTEASGKSEYIFLQIDEELEVKLQAQNFATLINKPDKTCTNAPNYSELECSELEIWKDIVKEVHCQGPWMKAPNARYCQNPEAMEKLITTYQKKYDENVEPSAYCERPCKSIIYSTFIQNRKKIKQPVPSSQIYLYFSSKSVIMYEERIGYDFSQFVADMSGSLGFLLGLSVLRIIGFLQNMGLFILGYFITRKQLKIDEENNQNQKK